MVEKRIDCVKKEIRSVLITAKNGLTLEEFRKAYRTLCGVRLPTREFGYTLDIDFLRSIPDVVHIKVEKNGNNQLYAIADETTEHIQKLVSKQRLPKPKINCRTSTNCIKFNQCILTKDTNRCRPFVPAKLRGEIIEIVKQYPDGIGYTSLVVAYQNVYKKHLNLEWLSSFPEEQFQKLVNAVPELGLKLTGNQGKIYYLNQQNNASNEQLVSKSYSIKKHLKAAEKSTATSSSVFQNNGHLDSSAVPEVVKSRFEKILKQYPYGILAVHFPILYEKITKAPLDIYDLGFSSLIELADALPTIFFHIEAPGSSKDQILLHREFYKNVPHVLGTYVNEMSPSNRRSPIPSSVLYNKSPLTLSPAYCMSENPLPGVAPSNLPYIQAELPEDAKNKFIPVYVSAITNPSQFWFQLQTKEAISNFEKLEKDIISFYSNQPLDIYKLSDADMLIGSSCIAFSSVDNYWYRTVITALPDVNYATVAYVDYGSMERIHRSRLYYLKYSFITFPVHAYEAQLASVKPAAQVWSKRACDRFIQLCNNAFIMAKIETVHNSTVSISLCDTNGEENIYVHDVLVNERFAVIDFDGKFDSRSLCGESQAEQNLRNNTIISSPDTKARQILPEDTPKSQVKDPRPSLSSFYLRNRTEKPKLSPKRLFNELDLHTSYSKKRKRFVKNIILGDGYKINIIVVADEAFVSGGDLCNLFWNDKEADVLALRLKIQYDGFIPTRTIFEEDFEELFSQCKKYSVKGFYKSEKRNALVLYPVKFVMKVLNIFGHPSLRVRETLHKEIELFDANDKLWEEYNEPIGENEEKHCQETENACKELCLYDLKAKFEALRFKRFTLTKDLQENPNSSINYALQIERIESMQNAIKKQMEEITAVCSLYASSAST